jgi:hypothetical protein
VTQLFASVIAGALWDMTGPQGAFLAGAGFALLTVAGLLSIRSGRGGGGDWPGPIAERARGRDDQRENLLFLVGNYAARDRRYRGLN